MGHIKKKELVTKQTTTKLEKQQKKVRATTITTLEQQQHPFWYIFADLISEYQQYQEATVDDYDSDEGDQDQDSN